MYNRLLLTVIATINRFLDYFGIISLETLNKTNQTKFATIEDPSNEMKFWYFVLRKVKLYPSNNNRVAYFLHRLLVATFEQICIFASPHYQIYGFIVFHRGKCSRICHYIGLICVPVCILMTSSVLYSLDYVILSIIIRLILVIPFISVALSAKYQYHLA
eukprot:413549_1